MRREGCPGAGGLRSRRGLGLITGPPSAISRRSGRCPHRLLLSAHPPWGPGVLMAEEDRSAPGPGTWTAGGAPPRLYPGRTVSDVGWVDRGDAPRVSVPPPTSLARTPNGPHRVYTRAPVSCLCVRTHLCLHIDTRSRVPHHSRPWGPAGRSHASRISPHVRQNLHTRVSGAVGAHTFLCPWADAPRHTRWVPPPANLRFHTRIGLHLHPRRPLSRPTRTEPTRPWVSRIHRYGPRH